MSFDAWVDGEGDGVLYRQCLLEKANVSYIVWIPQEYAKLRSVIKVKRDGVWEDGWVVKEIYGKGSNYIIDSTRHERAVVKGWEKKK